MSAMAHSGSSASNCPLNPMYRSVPAIPYSRPTPVEITAANKPNRATTELDIADLLYVASIPDTANSPRDTSVANCPLCAILQAVSTNATATFRMSRRPAYGQSAPPDSALC